MSLAPAIHPDIRGACREEKIYPGHRYPKRWHDGKLRATHKVNWEKKYGPVPDGFELHHACENKACTNEDHLRLVTREVHARLHMRDRCRNGLHALTPENVSVTKKGRICLACKRSGDRRRYHARKEAAR